MLRVWQRTGVIVLGLLTCGLAGCVADQPVVEPQTVPERPVLRNVNVTTDAGDPIHSAELAESGSPFALQGNDWQAFRASVSGQAGSWLFLYVPLPAPSNEEHWSYSIEAVAEAADEGPTVLLSTDIETVVGDGRSEPNALLPRLQAYVSFGEAAAYAEAHTVSSYVGGDRGTLGFFYAATANTPWTADLTIEPRAGTGPANVTFLQIGNGTVVHDNVSRQDNSLDLGADVTYDIAYDIGSPGWTHFHFLGADEGLSKWEWTADFPEASDNELLLASFHAPPALRLRGDLGVLDGDAGRFEGRIRTIGNGPAPVILFIHAPGFGSWLPDGFGSYV